MKQIKLSTWAKEHDIHYMTAWRWIKEGKFPDEYIKNEYGSIFVIVKDNHE